MAKSQDHRTISRFQRKDDFAPGACHVQHGSGSGANTVVEGSFKSRLLARAASLHERDYFSKIGEIRSAQGHSKPAISNCAEHLATAMHRQNGARPAGVQHNRIIGGKT